MSTLALAGIGFVILIILTIGIYLITRKLAMRAIYGASTSSRIESPAEPLYETPMPRKIVESVDAAEAPVKNPLIEFIEEWEEPTPDTVPEPVPSPETGPEPEPVAEEKEKPEKKPSRKTKEKKEKTSEPEENPLIKFIEEWEEPGSENSGKK